MNQKEAIVIKNQNYKETSKIVYLYTKDGIVSCIAKGAHRKESKIRPFIEAISKVNVNLSNANFPTLISAEIMDNHTNIKYDLEKQVYAVHMLELIYKLAIEVNHEKIYTLLNKVLDVLDKTTNPEIVAFTFELKLLFYLGYALDFEHVKFYTNVFEQIKLLYFIKFDDLDSIIIDKQFYNNIRKEIDILYSDFFSFRTNARTVLNDVFNYK